MKVEIWSDFLKINKELLICNDGLKVSNNRNKKRGLSH